MVPPVINLEVAYDSIDVTQVSAFNFKMPFPVLKHYWWEIVKQQAWCINVVLPEKQVPGIPMFFKITREGLADFYDVMDVVCELGNRPRTLLLNRKGCLSQLLYEFSCWPFVKWHEPVVIHVWGCKLHLPCRTSGSSYDTRNGCLCFDLQQGLGELGQLWTRETVTSGVVIDTHVHLQQWIRTRCKSRPVRQPGTCRYFSRTLKNMGRPGYDAKKQVFGLSKNLQLFCVREGLG